MVQALAFDHPTTFGWVVLGTGAVAVAAGVQPLSGIVRWGTAAITTASCIAWLLVDGRTPSLVAAGVWFLMLALPSAVSDYRSARVSLWNLGCATISASAWYGAAGWRPVFAVLLLGSCFALAVFLSGQQNHFGVGDVAVFAAFLGLAPALTSVAAIAVALLVQILLQHRLGANRSAIVPALALAGVPALVLTAPLWWYGPYPGGVLG